MRNLQTLVQADSESQIARRRFVCTCLGATAGLFGFGPLAACGGGSGAATSPNTALPLGSSRDPNAVAISFADVSRFAAVLRSEAAGFPTLEQSLQTRYIDPGSLGLKSLLNSHIGGVAQLAQSIRAAAAYYAAALPQLEAIASDAALMSRIRSALQNLKARVPDASFVPITYVVGRLTVGGTATPDGVLMGAEFFVSNPQTQALASPGVVRDNLRTALESALTVAHETAHVQQGLAMPFFLSPSRTLLQTSLIEGGADFVAQQIAGSQNNAYLSAWADPREALLWAEFRQVMNGTNTSNWIYNQANPPAGRPGDLGYYIGRKICESYYATQTDKDQALRNILRIQDASLFVSQSGYAQRFPA
jgi:hypothetical protein